MDYLKYTITGWDHGQREILLAFLSQLPFEAFEEQEEAILAYASVREEKSDLERSLAILQRQRPFAFAVEQLPAQNWNEVWESNFESIRIADFCLIRAPFHPEDPTVALDIIINPKMAFGTGHHATTYIMIWALSGRRFSGRNVLDYGCGTGVLAIAAARLQAERVDAIDIDHWAVENAVENARLNGVETVVVRQSNLEDWSEGGYDLILANINRNVILKSLPALYIKLNSKGRLLVSGILVDDRDLVLESATKSGFRLFDIKQREEWLMLEFEK